MAELFQPSPAVSEKAYIKSMQQYKELYEKSIKHNQDFWAECARTLVDWHRPFTTVSMGGFTHGDMAWFPDGELNVSYNCLDRHVARDPNKLAIIHEGDAPGEVRRFTYGDLLREVCRLAHVLKDEGLVKGDTVALYMPHVPEAIIAMLACTRLGLVHSVVFGGFSAEALQSRLLDANCKVVITSDEALRGGKKIPLKTTVDEALLGCPSVRRVIVLRHTGSPVKMAPGRDVYWDEAVATKRPYIPPVPCNSEDPLFMLYTSGSTGKPKGILHTTGGYLVYATLTFKHIFDYHPGDIFMCTADVGWITGHSYVAYGPLSNGATSVTFEGVPTYPDPGRLWAIVAQHRITHLYTAPTAIRALKKLGDSHVLAHDRSSLRVLGTVGEPINPEAWLWYHNVVGEGRCPIVDTFWQTETGGIMVTPLPGATPTKPGSATLPFWGIEPVILEPTTGAVLEGGDVTGVLAFARPWPGQSRTIFGDHNRYLDTYLKPYPGYYFTGDGATRDADGYIWIRGRVDDVINVSGHRLGTAEIESALVASGICAEAAVIGAPDEITGQAIYCFCILKDGVDTSGQDVVAFLRQQVRAHVGPVATPSRIYIVPNLPKTRSGKIMRRILRKISAGESDQLGDISTLADPDIVAVLIDMIKPPNSA